MNLVTVLAHVPWPIVCGWLLANLIPYLSALSTKAPTWATGAVTLVLSAADGVLADVARGNVDPRAVIGTALVSWAIASMHHSKILRGTQVEANLHALPRKGNRPKPYRQPMPPAAPAMA